MATLYGFFFIIEEIASSLPSSTYGSQFVNRFDRKKDAKDNFVYVFSEKTKLILKRTVSRDFSSPIIFIEQLHLGP
jgi:hypothetical protein